MASTEGIRIIETLPLQVRHNRVRLSKFQAIQNSAAGWGRISVKPGRTGMWTSSYTPDNSEGICDWLRWCKGESFHVEAWRSAYVYEITRPLRIIEIDSLADLLALNDAFGLPSEVSVTLNARDSSHPISRYPNWQLLAKHFDAVHLTEEGQWATRLSHPDELYGWDCESTLWLRLHRRTLRLAKKIHLGIGGRRKSRKDYREEHQITMSQMRRFAEEWKREAA